jgi:hypothetical protein
VHPSPACPTTQGGGCPWGGPLGLEVSPRPKNKGFFIIKRKTDPRPTNKESDNQTARVFAWIVCSQLHQTLVNRIYLAAPSSFSSMHWNHQRGMLWNLCSLLPSELQNTTLVGYT